MRNGKFSSNVMPTSSCSSLRSFLNPCFSSFEAALRTSLFVEAELALLEEPALRRASARFAAFRACFASFAARCFGVNCRSFAARCGFLASFFADLLIFSCSWLSVSFGFAAFLSVDDLVVSGDAFLIWRLLAWRSAEDCFDSIFSGFVTGWADGGTLARWLLGKSSWYCSSIAAMASSMRDAGPLLVTDSPVSLCISLFAGVDGVLGAFLFFLFLDFLDFLDFRLEHAGPHSTILSLRSSFAILLNTSGASGGTVGSAADACRTADVLQSLSCFNRANACSEGTPWAFPDTFRQFYLNRDAV